MKFHFKGWDVRCYQGGHRHKRSGGAEFEDIKLERAKTLQHKLERSVKYLFKKET